MTILCAIDIDVASVSWTLKKSSLVSSGELVRHMIDSLRRYCWSTFDLHAWSETVLANAPLAQGRSSPC